MTRESKGREGKGREGNGKGIITGRIANNPETRTNKGLQPFCSITLF